MDEVRDTGSGILELGVGRFRVQGFRMTGEAEVRGKGSVSRVQGAGSRVQGPTRWSSIVWLVLILNATQPNLLHKRPLSQLPNASRSLMNGA